MPEQLLHRADVVPVFEQGRRNAMPHRVRANPFRKAGLPRGAGHGLLDYRLVQAIPRRRAPSRIYGNPFVRLLRRESASRPDYHASREERAPAA